MNFRKQQKEQEVRTHNEKRGARPVYQPWSRVSPRVVDGGYTPILNIDYHLTIALATSVKHDEDQRRFRGYPPRFIGCRAKARSLGFQNVTHMQRVARERQMELDSFATPTTVL